MNHLSSLSKFPMHHMHMHMHINRCALNIYNHHKYLSSLSSLSLSSLSSLSSSSSSIHHSGTHTHARIHNNQPLGQGQYHASYNKISQSYHSSQALHKYTNTNAPS